MRVMDKAKAERRAELAGEIRDLLGASDLTTAAHD